MMRSATHAWQLALLHTSTHKPSKLYDDPWAYEVRFGMIRSTRLSPEDRDAASTHLLARLRRSLLHPATEKRQT